MQPVKKSRFSLKRRSAFRTGAKIYLSKKNTLGLWALQHFAKKSFLHFPQIFNFRPLSQAVKKKHIPLKFSWKQGDCVVYLERNKSIKFETLAWKVRLSHLLVKVYSNLSQFITRPNLACSVANNYHRLFPFLYFTKPLNIKTHLINWNLWLVYLCCWFNKKVLNNNHHLQYELTTSYLVNQITWLTSYLDNVTILPLISISEKKFSIVLCIVSIWKKVMAHP